MATLMPYDYDLLEVDSDTTKRALIDPALAVPSGFTKITKVGGVDVKDGNGRLKSAYWGLYQITAADKGADVLTALTTTPTPTALATPASTKKQGRGFSRSPLVPDLD